MIVIVVLVVLLTVLSLSAAGVAAHLRKRAAEQPPVGLVATLRQVPSTVGFLRRLATDDSLPAGVRLRLGAVLVYLVFPVDRLPLVGRRVRR